MTLYPIYTLRKIVFVFTFVILLVFVNSKGYSQDNFYTTTGLEMIFSWADIQQDGVSQPSILRWAPVFNIQTFFNYDLSNKFGLFSGVGVRNVGFIYDESPSVRKKYRTYNLAIPVGIKIGKLDKAFIYAGYELEIPFNYKEKTFVNEQKSKYSVWFSDRVPNIYNSVLLGVQLPKGLNLKFKYYITEFFNSSFKEVDQDTGDITEPYADLHVNVFFVSLSINLLKDTKVYYLEID